jgi:hypothetical protein
MNATALMISFGIVAVLTASLAAHPGAPHVGMWVYASPGNVPCGGIAQRHA